MKAQLTPKIHDKPKLAFFIEILSWCPNGCFSLIFVQKFFLGHVECGHKAPNGMLIGELHVNLLRGSHETRAYNTL